MLLFSNLTFCILLPTTLASVIWNGQLPSVQGVASRATTIRPSDDATDDLSSMPNDVPKPDETIGEYFDEESAKSSQNMSLVEVASSKRTSAKRTLQSSRCNLTSTWTDGPTQFSINLEKSLGFSVSVGDWPAFDGTMIYNATFLDIERDLRANITAHTDAQAQYGARILANAQQTLAGLEGYLKSAVCDYDYTADPMHDELRRKLLEVDGFWVGTLYKSVLASGVGAGVYGGFFNPHNHTTGQVVAAGIAGAGLTFMISVIDRMQLNGRLSSTEAFVIATFVSWYNKVMHALSPPQIGADTAVSGQIPCFPQNVVEDAMKNLQDLYDVELGFDPQVQAICASGN